jgi:site-specific recombinase XerD
LAGEASDIGQFIGYLDRTGQSVSLTSLTLSVIRAYLTDLAKKGRKPKTIKHHLTTLRNFTRYLSQEHLLIDSWTTQVKGPRIVERRADPLTSDEVHHLLAVIPHYTAVGQRDHCLLSLFLLSGLRIGEMLALTVADIRLEDHTVIVRHGKNDKDRAVPLTTAITQEVAAYIATVRPAFMHPNSPPQLFLSRLGRPLGATSARDRVRYYARNAGLGQRGIHPHQFRATFATRLDQTGTNVTVIQELMGHSNIETTSRYVGVAPQQMREAVHRLPPLE